MQPIYQLLVSINTYSCIQKAVVSRVFSVVIGDHANKEIEL